MPTEAIEGHNLEFPEDGDRYDGKPSAEQLLHDLARLFFHAGATINFPDDATRAVFAGPLQRVSFAIDEYHGSPEFQGHDESYDPGNGTGALMAKEFQAWHEVCDSLKVLLKEKDLDAPVNNVLIKEIELWGEHLAALREVQSTDTVEKAMQYRVGRLETARADEAK